MATGQVLNSPVLQSQHRNFTRSVTVFPTDNAPQRYFIQHSGGQKQALWVMGNIGNLVRGVGRGKLPGIRHGAGVMECSSHHLKQRGLAASCCPSEHTSRTGWNVPGHSGYPPLWNSKPFPDHTL